MVSSGDVSGAVVYRYFVRDARRKQSQFVIPGWVRQHAGPE
jgi:hypothetical protein